MSLSYVMRKNHNATSFNNIASRKSMMAPWLIFGLTLRTNSPVQKLPTISNTDVTLFKFSIMKNSTIFGTRTINKKSTASCPTTDGIQLNNMTTPNHSGRTFNKDSLEPDMDLTFSNAVTNLWVCSQSTKPIISPTPPPTSSQSLAGPKSGG